jgi:hypothetical protein
MEDYEAALWVDDTISSANERFMNHRTRDAVLRFLLPTARRARALALVIATLWLSSAVTGRGADGADHSEEAISAVSRLLEDTTVVRNNVYYVAFETTSGQASAPPTNGFVQPVRPQAASPAVQSGVMEITTYGQFDPFPLKAGPGSDWNEQVTLRVRSFRIESGRGWSRPTLLGINILQWTVASSGGQIQVFVQPVVGPTGIKDEGIRELVAAIFNLPPESVSVSKPASSG